MRYFAAGPSLLVLALVGCGGGSASDGASGGASGTPNAGAGTSGGVAAAGSSGAPSSGGGVAGSLGGTAGAPTQPSGGGGSGGDAPSGDPEDWQNATGNLANMPSECGNLGLVSAEPGTSRVIAGVAQKGLWVTTDGGKTWAGLGSGAGSAVITNRISAIVWDPDHPGTFWESGIYNGGGVYKTTDDGGTFSSVGNVTHNDSVSVDLGDSGRKTMLAGTHESAQKLFRSTDAGVTWADIGQSLPADSGYCTSTVVLDSKTFLVGCSGAGASTGIYRSTDAGGSWKRVGTRPVWNQPLITSATELYWVDTQGGIDKSTDNGASFTQVASGNTAVSVIGPTTLAQLPDGRIVVVGADHLQASADGGKTWKAVGHSLPFTGGGFDGASGVTYSVKTKMFFIWRWTCTNAVPNNAIMSLAFDYETQ